MDIMMKFWSFGCVHATELNEVADDLIHRTALGGSGIVFHEGSNSASRPLLQVPVFLLFHTIHHALDNMARSLRYIMKSNQCACSRGSNAHISLLFHDFSLMDGSQGTRP